MAKKEKGLWDTITQPFTEAVDTLEGGYTPESSRIPMNPDTYKTADSSSNQVVPPVLEERVPASTTESDPQPLPSPNGENGEEDGSLWGALKGVGSKAMEWVDDHPEGAMDLMIGATPVLMGYLTGHKEQGFTWGSKGLLQRYDEGREDAKEARTAQSKLESAIAKKKEGAIKAPTIRSVMDPTTKVSTDRMYNPSHPEANEYGWVDTGMITGSSKKDLSFANQAARGKSVIDIEKHGLKTAIDLDAYRTKGSNKIVSADPNTGLIWERDRMGITPDRLVFNPEGLNPVQKKSAAPIVKSYNSETKESRDFMHGLKSQVDRLVMDNQFANKTAIREIIIAIEKRLTDKDAQHYEGEVSFLKDLKRKWYDTAKTSRISPRLVREVLETTAVYFNKTRDSIESKRKMFGSQFLESDGNLTPEQADKVFGEREQWKELKIPMFRENKETGKMEKIFIPTSKINEASKDGFVIIRGME